MRNSVKHPAIDREALWRSIVEMGQIGKVGEGRTRLALSELDLEARRLLTHWMKRLNLEVQTDCYANLWGTRPGTDASAKPVVIGSHIDTVRDAGMFDGVLGVLSGLAVIRAMNEAGVVTRRPVSVISFTDEEGGHFSSGGLSGSRLMAGMADLDVLGRACNPEGLSWRQALDESGFAGNGKLEPHAYLEYHIEQGPVLADDGIQIGAVKGIVGIVWMRVTFTGEANHAGAFPMNRRHDAGLAAAEAVVELNRLAFDLGHDTVVMPGQVNLYPNLPNIVPGKAIVTIDIRQFEPDLLAKGVAGVKEIAAEAAKRQGVGVEIEILADTPQAAFSEEMISLVERKALALGYSVKRMPSGAGHDAQVMNRLCPGAMIFAPSKDGRSHCPEEYTSPDDVGNGAEVLLHCVLELAEIE